MKKIFEVISRFRDGNRRGLIVSGFTLFYVVVDATVYRTRFVEFVHGNWALFNVGAFVLILTGILFWPTGSQPTPKNDGQRLCSTEK
jgi:K+ transporter